jgi:hypothetical protein
LGFTTGIRVTILVIEEEKPLKLLTRGRAVETATGRQLLRCQEALLTTVLRHEHSTYATVTRVTVHRARLLSASFHKIVGHGPNCSNPAVPSNLSPSKNVIVAEPLVPPQSNGVPVAGVL